MNTNQPPTPNAHCAVDAVARTAVAASSSLATGGSGRARAASTAAGTLRGLHEQHARTRSIPTAITQRAQHHRCNPYERVVATSLVLLLNMCALLLFVICALHHHAVTDTLRHMHTLRTVSAVSSQLHQSVCVVREHALCCCWC
jgi:hypothetical protein